MKPLCEQRLRALTVFVSCCFALLLSAAHVSAANTIGGFVFDRARTPLSDIDVELLDEYYRLKQRLKTESSGRYEFSGLNDGNYTVRVFAFRYDLEDQSQYVEIKSISSIAGQAGSSYNPVDFYLQPKKGGLRDAELSVIFAQNVPKAAEQSYKKAIDDFSKKKTDEGFIGLQQALTIFPTYYTALQRYGQELYIRKQYGAATQVFMTAAEVNPRSAMPFYYAGHALSKMGDKYNRNAKLALAQALSLAPASTPVLLLLGTIERRLGMLLEAESHLLSAKKLSPARVPEIQKELAQLYANDLKKYKEAADELEQYVKASKLSDEDSTKTKQLIADLRQKAKTQTAN
ncbi:MAG: carboxypeptidase-like regulatory domain-containing protein [bacterium]|nr:carboxypeptidase-like regulatory domain-containing protein [bacterium]